MSRFTRIQKILGGLLVALLLANLISRWPQKASAEGRASGMTPTGGPSEEMRQTFQASLQKLPEGQRKLVEERLAVDRTFFESVKNLSMEERHQKMDEHFAANPPLDIPGLEMPRGPRGQGGQNTAGGPGDDGPGPGGPGKGHIPSPEVRRGMDQNIVNSQRNTP